MYLTQLFIWLRKRQPEHTRPLDHTLRLYTPGNFSYLWLTVVSLGFIFITLLIAISFLEFLVENNISHSAIANYISAIKTNLALYGLPTYSFQDPRIAYFQRSLSLHEPFSPAVKKIMDIPHLISIVSICDTMWMGQVFKTLYLTAFFSFLHNFKSCTPFN